MLSNHSKFKRHFLSKAIQELHDNGFVILIVTNNYTDLVKFVFEKHPYHVIGLELEPYSPLFDFPKKSQRIRSTFGGQVLNPVLAITDSPRDLDMLNMIPNKKISKDIRTSLLYRLQPPMIN